MIPDRLISVHFPKAAGSSLQRQFLSLLGNEVELDYGHDPLTGEGDQLGAFRAGKRIVHGHFKANRYAHVAAYWLTFLRHPVENLISIFYFWQSLPPERGHALHSRFLREKPSILEFAKFPGINTLMSETYFGGFDMRRFNFIGFYETRQPDMTRLAIELALPLRPALHENKTTGSAERDELMRDPPVLHRLRDVLSADVSFYEKIRYSRR
jgi:hypothetical protein